MQKVQTMSIIKYINIGPLGKPLECTGMIRLKMYWYNFTWNGSACECEVPPHLAYFLFDACMRLHMYQAKEYKDELKWFTG